MQGTIWLQIGSLYICAAMDGHYSSGKKGHINRNLGTIVRNCSEIIDSPKPDSAATDLKAPVQETQQLKEAGQEISSSNSLKTGDESTIFFWIILSILASCILIGSFKFLFHGSRKNKTDLEKDIYR